MICNHCGCNMQHTTVGWKCYNCQPKIYYSSGTGDSLQKQLETERARVRVLRDAIEAALPVLDGPEYRVLEHALAATQQRLAECEADAGRMRLALETLISVAEKCDGWESFPSDALDAAIDAARGASHE